VLHIFINHDFTKIYILQTSSDILTSRA
jgi:hypothetical protein